MTVPDVTWCRCLICCAAAQADNKKYRKKELHPRITRRSGNVAFCADTSPIGKIERRTDSGRLLPVSRCLYGISPLGLGMTRILPFKAREGPRAGMTRTGKSGQSTTCARFLGAAGSVRFPDIEYRANKRPFYHSSTDQLRQVSKTSLPAYKTRWTMPRKTGRRSRHRLPLACFDTAGTK